MRRGRKIKTLIALLVLAGAFFGGGLVLRNILLNQVRKKIAPVFNYARLKLSVLPPAVVLENVRSIATSPFFSAQKVVLQIPIRSILSSRRSLQVFVEGFVARIYDNQEGPAKPFSLDFRLPFLVENGVILDGEVYYWGRGMSVIARGVRAYFRQSKDAFVIRAEVKSQAVSLPSLARPLEGRSEIFVEARGEELFLRRLTIQGSDLLLRAKGVLTDPKNPVFDIQTTVRGPIALIADLLDLPFRWTGTAEGAGRIVRQDGQVRFMTGIESRNMTFTGMPVGRVTGTVTVENGEGRIDLEISKPRSTVESLELRFGGGKLEGRARGVHLDPLIKQINIPWPVGSAAWGSFTLARKILEVYGEFRDDPLPEENGRFPFRGQFRLAWDVLRKTIVFSSEKIESNFGSMRVDGFLDIGREVRIELAGEATDIPRGRAFTSLALRLPITIPVIRGRGRAEIKILGDWQSPQVKIDFALAPASFARFEAAEASGLVEIAKGETWGTVRARDPELQGLFKFQAVRGSWSCQVENGEGSVEKIFTALALDVPLKGRAAGSLQIRDDGGGILVDGDFSAARAEIFGRPVRDVRGRFGWSTAEFRLSLADIKGTMYGGTVEGSAIWGIRSRDYEIDAAARNVILATLAPEVRGRLDLTVKGRGNLDRDPGIPGSFTITDLGIGAVEKTQASGDLDLSLGQKTARIHLNGLLDPGRNTFDIVFRYPEEPGTYSATASGSLFNLDLVVPWKGARGEIRYLAEVRGGGPDPARWNGVLDFKGPVLPFPKFAHALTDYSGLVRIENNVATVRSLQGQLGGGDVFGSGEIRFGPGGLELLDLRADGREMTLSLFERTRGLADGSFRLLKNSREFVLSGDVLVRKLSWRREVSEKFDFSASPYPDTRKGPGPFDDLALDIRLRAEDNAVLENTLGKIEGRFDLSLTGTPVAPIVLGDLEGLRGEIRFQDRTFRLLRARLSFFNPMSIEPYLDFRGETYLKDYRVTFSLGGVLNRLRPEFVSSPPLPPEDVLALLAMGESFKRTYSYDASSQMGTGSLMSFQLADEATRRAEQLFRLDRFRIDPFVLGASTEMTARLTVGKKISRNLMLLYSTNLTSQREEIIRLEWEFSESFSLVGMKDERGRFSLDAKIRTRF
jgi:hypothetical protein